MFMIILVCQTGYLACVLMLPHSGHARRGGLLSFRGGLVFNGPDVGPDLEGCLTTSSDFANLRSESAGDRAASWRMRTPLAGI